MIEPLISVIVPIYKVEEYLQVCVDSIINQTYKNLEIILVDDGSPDRCGKICDEYAEKDKRIKVIHKQNGGLSDARNVGLKEMSGEYLIFVDSDDWLPENAIKTLWKVMRDYNVDLVIGNHQRVFDNVQMKFNEDIERKIDFMDKEGAMKEFFENGCASWARLYKRKVHEDIFFPLNEINEDEAIVLKILDKCEYVVKVESIVYFYRCREESITTSKFSKKKMIWQKHCKDNWEYIKGKYPKLEKEAIVRYRGSLLWLLTEIALSQEEYKEEREMLINELSAGKNEFLKIQFSNMRDKIRMFVLLYLPFEIYKGTLRFFRKMR